MGKAQAIWPGVKGDTDTGSDAPVPHPAHYQQWFAYFDTIDLRRHLRDIEIVLRRRWKKPMAQSAVRRKR